MLRKLIKVGTSAAVIIPKEILNEINVEVGDVVSISVERASKRKASPLKPTIRPEIIEWTDELIKRYGPLWKKLAKS